MAVTYELEERRVIPNWREYKRTLILGELNSDGKPSAPFEIDIQRAISDWSISKSIGTAADLVNAAFISGKFKQQEVTEAISFIHAHENESSQSLIDLAKIIASSSSNTGQDSVENRKELLAIGVDSIEEFQSIRDVKAFHKILHKTRLRAYNELYNPILWVELARQYSIVGQEKKAEHAMETALYLAPSNRFVIRSATRCFVHIGKLEKAVFYLRKNISTKHDPWLISAHIATSSMMGRYSPLIKDGIALLKSNNFSNFSTTELASSLGTIELKEGSFRKQNNSLIKLF
jgi:tetratricopeptide (TPR) repeat protein